jgi:GNAT superfamily N-acetyltransferase
MGKKMKKNTSIRHALLEDISQILPLMEQLGYPQDQEEFEERFHLFLRQPGYGISVAGQSSSIQGVIAWSQSFSLVIPYQRIRIEGLIVDSNYRGQGVGKALMQFVEKSVETLRPCVIELTSGARRAKEGTHAFYNALGYHNDGPAEKLYLRKMLHAL